MWEFAGGPGKDGRGVSGLVPHCEQRSKLRGRLKWFDMVLGYDPVSLAALEPYIPPKVHRGILQGGFDAGEWKRTERDWFSERFGFIMHGALNDRKQPWLAIQAFQELKFEKGADFAGATLALHTNAPGKLFPELNEPFRNSKIRVFVDAFDKPTLDEFYASAHCLLAPSRGEGKNLPALEFMTTGGVVAATNFGGHTMWMNGDYAYPLDYELAPTFPGRPWAAHDARVSTEHLKEVIWHIYTHRAEAREKGSLAARTIPQMCDWQTVIEDLFRRVGDQVTGPGPEVAAQAFACRREPEPGPPAGVPVSWGRA
jgi:glycosyltransferase involved in cell wall biosynthesis